MASRPINWIDDVLPAAKHGRLLELLDTLPRHRWTERNLFERTFLHYACIGDNVAAAVALLRHGGVNVNACTESGHTAAHHATYYSNARMLEVLCAAGASLRCSAPSGEAPLDVALELNTRLCAHVLIANGVRLSTVRENHRMLITPELEAFERGVLRCRAAVVAILRVKRASRQLVRWDRFVLALIAHHVWMTRANLGWAK